jgi:hypothetical protein
MITRHDPEYGRQIPPRPTGDPDRKPIAGVRLDELATLIRDAQRLIGSRGSEGERTAFLVQKARLLRRIDDSDELSCRGESR